MEKNLSERIKAVADYFGVPYDMIKIQVYSQYGSEISDENARMTAIENHIKDLEKTKREDSISNVKNATEVLVKTFDDYEHKTTILIATLVHLAKTDMSDKEFEDTIFWACNIANEAGIHRDEIKDFLKNINKMTEEDIAKYLF